MLVGLWAVSQVVGLSTVPIGGVPDAAVGSLAPLGSAGIRLQAVVGSGLMEETLYRGFLLTQAYAWLRQRTSRAHALAWAVVVTSVYFGLNHVPAGLRAGLSTPAALGFAAHAGLAGALFAAIYLRTGNLFVAAGAHALINDPVGIVSPLVDPSIVVLVSASVLLLAWPLLAKHVGRVFTVGTVEGVPAV